MKKINTKDGFLFFFFSVWVSDPFAFPAVSSWTNDVKEWLRRPGLFFAKRRGACLIKIIVITTGLQCFVNAATSFFKNLELQKRFLTREHLEHKNPDINEKQNDKVIMLHDTVA